jgi:hypothetical protein
VAVVIVASQWLETHETLQFFWRSALLISLRFGSSGDAPRLNDAHNKSLDRSGVRLLSVRET